MAIYGHFFANYINFFHKTEIQTVILSLNVLCNPHISDVFDKLCFQQYFPHYFQCCWIVQWFKGPNFNLYILGTLIKITSETYLLD